MNSRRVLVGASMLLLLGACAGGSSNANDSPRTTQANDPSTTSADQGSGATGQILGEDTRFAAGGSGAADVEGDVNERECKLTGTVFGSCRASTGSGGGFFVTAEGTPDAPSEWNVVVRCGLHPAAPVTSAKGTFQPQTADLGLLPYGELVGVTLRGADATEGALVYQPAGSDCPVVWGLGPIDPSSLFTGGTDRLNGDERPIQFTQPGGVVVCAVGDGSGGIEVSPASGASCAP